MPRSDTLPFRPRARLLLLLGDQLIRDPGIAVFELVKNAYDADASKVTVMLKNVDDPDHAAIIVKDDGTGMTWDTVTGIWLEPGTDHKAVFRAAGRRTPIYGRMPLGEKGVGRFAVHKLGHQVELVTRSEESPNEVVVSINWEDFSAQRYMTDVKVTVFERTPKVFKKSCGTKITITKLRGKWSRGLVRSLHRSIVSICSPFAGPADFKAELTLTPDRGWLEGLLDINQVLASSPFRAKGYVEGRNFWYDYSFVPPPAMNRVTGRVMQRRVSLSRDDVPIADGEGVNIGPITIDLYIFDRDPQTFSFITSDRKGLKEFLDTTGGMRVYRDNIRVYDYGEPGNDWLDLGVRRVNTPAKAISRNILVGAITLDPVRSSDLIEKTNREGFVENSAAEALRNIVLSALTHIETERNKDKLRIRDAYSSSKVKEPVLDDINALRIDIEKRGLGVELGQYVDRIERQFNDVRDRLLTAASAGLGLTVVIHEVEKGIRELMHALERRASLTVVKELAAHLEEVVEGLTYLARTSTTKEERASKLVSQAIFNVHFRLKYHGISIVNGFEQTDSDFSVRCSRRLIVSAIMNLLDNAIYWLDVKGGTEKQIYVGPSLDGQNAIVVADNGPGFIDPPEFVVQPFITRKRDGMGLGLHIVSEIMKAHNGTLSFPDKGDLNVPQRFDGAVLALVFGR